MRRVFFQVQKWVDDLLDDFRADGPLLPFILIIALSIPFRAQRSIIEFVVFWFLVFGAITWLIFVGWRIFHSLKRQGLKGGREYERRGRYRLPPEYAESEDALLAAKRRKAKRKRK